MFVCSLTSFWSSKSTVFYFVDNLLLFGILTISVDTPPIVARSYSGFFELVVGLSALFFELSFCTLSCIRVFELFFTHLNPQRFDTICHH